MFLRLDEVSVEVAGKPVLQGLSLELGEGEVLALIGSAGCGKSTILRAIFGLVRVTAGRVVFRDQDIANRSPRQNLADGIVLVPQGGRVFRSLSVSENLHLAAHTLSEPALVEQRIHQVYSFLPRLRERQWQAAGSLSGGERQMLALGMALMIDPRLLLLDEPSTGLSPILAERVLDQVRKMAGHLPSGILIVEQNVKNAAYVGDRVSVLRRGRIALTRSGKTAEDIQALLDAYAFKPTAD